MFLKRYGAGGRLIRHVVAAGMLLVSVRQLRADWIDTFDGGLHQSWSTISTTNALRSSPSFSFASDGTQLVITDPVPAAGGGTNTGVGYVNQSFHDVEMTATFNPAAAANMNAHLSLVARGNPSAYQAYVFGIDWFDTEGVPKGFVFLNRIDGLGSQTYLATGWIPGFTLAEDPFVQFTLIGRRLVGEVYDAPGGNLLVSLSALDATYSSGVSGVAVSVQDQSIPVLGTFDNVSAASVPEPSACVLGALGLCAIPLLGRLLRRRFISRG